MRRTATVLPAPKNTTNEDPQKIADELGLSVQRVLMIMAGSDTEEEGPR